MGRGRTPLEEMAFLKTTPPPPAKTYNCLTSPAPLVRAEWGSEAATHPSWKSVCVCMYESVWDGV